MTPAASPRRTRPGARIAGLSGVQSSVAGYWPRPQERPLLLAALLNGERGRSAWAAGRPELERAEPSLGAAWLRPLLVAAAERTDPDDPLLPGLRAEREEAVQRHGRLVAHLAPILGGMAEAGIPVMVLKGAALVAGGTDPGDRPMGDIDILVPPAAARAALALADRPPWRPRDAATPAFLRTWNAIHHSDRDWCHLDLHWHLFWQDRRPDAEDGLWSRSVPAMFGSIPVVRPGTTDALAHTLMHGARRGRTSAIRWVVDAWALLQTGEVDWDLLIAEGRARHMQTRLRRTLEYLVALLGAPVPPSVLDELRAGADLLDRAEHAFQAHAQGPLGAIPEYLCAYGRACAGPGPERWSGFPGYIADLWGLPSASDLPVEFGRRLRRRGIVRPRASA